MRFSPSSSEAWLSPVDSEATNRKRLEEKKEEAKWPLMGKINPHLYLSVQVAYGSEENCYNIRYPARNNRSSSFDGILRSFEKGPQNQQSTHKVRQMLISSHIHLSFLSQTEEDWSKYCDDVQGELASIVWKPALLLALEPYSNIPCRLTAGLLYRMTRHAFGSSTLHRLTTTPWPSKMHSGYRC